jgi:hypothetical protein
LVAYDIKLLLVSFDVPTKKIESFSLTSILNMAYYLQVRLGAYPGVDLFKTFLDIITHDFLKDRPFHYCQQCDSRTLNWCSLHKKRK